VVEGRLRPGGGRNKPDIRYLFGELSLMAPILDERRNPSQNFV